MKHELVIYRAPVEEEYQLLLPGDPGFAERRYRNVLRLAEQLTTKGWKFQKKTAPAGNYYDAYNFRTGAALMGNSCQDDRAAFINVIDRLVLP